MLKKSITIDIPLTVPKTAWAQYTKNYRTATGNSPDKRLFLFAGDQKIEHLNSDFHGANISPEDASPEHLFAIANKARIGAFATQLGLIAQYGKSYPNIPFIVKLNSKTNIIPTSQEDPLNLALHTVEQVIDFKKKTKLNIIGIGYTLYPGSVHEAAMLSQAAQIIHQAHQHGLITILWCYPRGKAVTDELSPAMIAGAAGIGTCLGADFIKVNPPKATSFNESAKLLQQASLAAGKSGIICSGGSSKDPQKFLEELYAQIHTGGSRGAAIGRNIHQKPLAQAINFCHAVAALLYDNADLKTAQKLLKK